MADTPAGSAGGATGWRTVGVLISQREGPAALGKKPTPASTAQGRPIGKPMRRAAGSPANRPEAAERGRAGAAPVQPTSGPAPAGPPAKAIVRASSIRAFAVASTAPGTSAGTSEGAATP